MVKLFVGQIPKTMEEDGIRPIMEEFGAVNEVKIIRDKLTNSHKGCCFVAYDTKLQADIAIAALHNKRTLGNLSTPMQVKYAEGESLTPNKLFVGMLTKTTTEQDLKDIFVPFGEIEEVAILRGPNNVGKGCGFVRYVARDSALKAISALNGAYKLEGAPANIIVKFADSEQLKQQKKAQQNTPPLGPTMDPAAAQALYQINPLLANIAASPLAATLLPTIAAALGIPSQPTGPPPHPPIHHTSGNPPPPPPPSYPAYPYPAAPYAVPGYPPPTYPPHGGAPAAAAAAAIAIVPELQVNTPQREGPAGCNLFIYHLPQEYTDISLSQLFSTYGNVLSAKVFVDKVTKQSKCFGFVSYDKPESAAAAIAALNGLQLGYKRLKVSLKKADQPSRSAPY